MVDIVALNQKILYFTQKGYLISHRNHGTDRAASAERCLHQFCRVAMEEDDSQITERPCGVTILTQRRRDRRVLTDNYLCANHYENQISVISVISV